MHKCLKSTCLKLEYGLFIHNYRVAAFSALYLTVLLYYNCPTQFEIDSTILTYLN